jgi:acetyl-CoA C-acetyltransferase
VNAYIYDAVRTPRGKGSEHGALAHVRPVELLEPLFGALAARNELDTSAVDDVILGCSTAAGEQGADIAKAAAHFAGWDYRSSGGTVSRLCCSGVDAIATAAAKVHAGMDSLVVAGGVESMSRVPIFSDDGPLFADDDVASAAGFVDLGLAADVVATLGEITREQCDAYALESHERAGVARDEGRFDRSLIPLNGLDRDEAIRDGQELADLAALAPAFAGSHADVVHEKLPSLGEIEHVHTVASAPQKVDGASLLLVGGKKGNARAEIISAANVGVKPPLLTATVPATQQALERAGMRLGDVDLFEVNESFAAIVLHYMRHFDIDPDRVNVNGGAIAMGHPLGATGGILTATALDELERRDLEVGLVTIPAAAGIGAALIIRRV